MHPTHQHGGQLKRASERYHIPLENWLDLSTGINPVSYPLPEVPTKVWQRLPEVNDGLELAAAAYYGSAALLPVSGSQEAIQCLPKLRQKSRVGIIQPAYHSHQQAWQAAGHEIVSLHHDDIDDQLSSLDVLVLVNPTNPTAHRYLPEQLHRWHHQLQQRDGWLVVDEAFMDLTPEGSLITRKPSEGLIVLRSIGKFFGLAGIRLGFVWATDDILQGLTKRQDDWAVSHPARWAGRLALADVDWQRQQRKLIPQKMAGLKIRLQAIYQCDVAEAGLFAYVVLGKEAAVAEHERLCKTGVLTRLFPEPGALRFGLEK
ncbi:MAG: threonine-phosphate decarboxylase [Proteobacteria bacterium]|nr:MAG: threonine-phosphate decarboxylase [Pseudomonadota bacterium]